MKKKDQIMLMKRQKLNINKKKKEKMRLFRVFKSSKKILKENRKIMKNKVNKSKIKSLNMSK